MVELHTWTAVEKLVRNLDIRIMMEDGGFNQRRSNLVDAVPCIVILYRSVSSNEAMPSTSGNGMIYMSWVM
jgi:hypothetical protein